MKPPACFSVFLFALVSCCLVGASTPCNLHPTQTGWQVFVDDRDRFCFEYPSKYLIAPPVFAPGGTPGTAPRFIGRLTTAPAPREVATVDDWKTATIDVFAERIPFRPADLTKRAPTGAQDSPPQHIHAAHGEFYYYGRGGGGVDYPDVFYFGIHGRTFSIVFTGPYTRGRATTPDNDPDPVNSPDPETKRIEPEVLASFRSF